MHELPSPQLGKDLIDLVGDAKAQQSAMAMVIQSNRRRDFEGRASRCAEADNGRKVVGSAFQPEAVTVTQTAIHLGAGREVFPAEDADIRTGRH